MASRVAFENRSILIDGKKTQLIAGAMHYFRVPRECWRDRLEKAVALGLNCIETYMCWNLHERREGEFDFSGRLDFEAYLKLVQEYGLYAIVRPGPYICSEWDNGGLPAWLMTKPNIEYRRSNAAYLEAVRNYFSVILPKLAALQIDNGGPIVAMQIENEYGSYGCDKNYLNYLRRLNRSCGVTVPLFTADGPGDLFLRGGMLDGAPVCLNFGSRGLEAFDLGKTYRPDDPPVCMEFWCGWFDAWGCGEHHTRSAESVAVELEDMLSAGGSVDFYMFHGGTNFELTSGANGTADSPYAPDVTSYDYDSLLSEAGDPTEKYFAVQNVIRKFRPDYTQFAVPCAGKKWSRSRVPVAACALLRDNLDRVSHKVENVSPLSFERLGLDFGYVFYRTHVPQGGLAGSFTLRQVRDRANIYLDGKEIGVYYRNDPSDRTERCAIPGSGATLELLVENLGRVNYGHLTGKDAKGICEDVAFEWQVLTDWEMWTLGTCDPGKRVEFHPFDTIRRGEPAYYRVDFELTEPADTFLEFPGVHGSVWVNGHILGRYWDIGPGRTLSVPGCWLKAGKNELVIFETGKLLKPYVNFLAEPDLAGTVKS